MQHGHAGQYKVPGPPLLNEWSRNPTVVNARFGESTNLNLCFDTFSVN